MENRKRLRIEGVLSIVRFSDGEVSIEGKEGNIGVEGTDLRIENLSKTDESLTVTGNITGVFMTEKQEEGGFFRKLFK